MYQVYSFPTPTVFRAHGNERARANGQRPTHSRTENSCMEKKKQLLLLISCEQFGLRWAAASDCCRCCLARLLTRGGARVRHNHIKTLHKFWCGAEEENKSNFWWKQTNRDCNRYPLTTHRGTEEVFCGRVRVFSPREHAAHARPHTHVRLPMGNGHLPVSSCAPAESSSAGLLNWMTLMAKKPHSS